MAARAAQLTPLILKFVAAARAPAPVFALDLRRIGASILRGFRQRASILVPIGSHSKLVGQATRKIKACGPLSGQLKPQDFFRPVLDLLRVFRAVLYFRCTGSRLLRDPGVSANSFISWFTSWPRLFQSISPKFGRAGSVRMSFHCPAISFFHVQVTRSPSWRGMRTRPW